MCPAHLKINVFIPYPRPKSVVVGQSIEVHCPTRYRPSDPMGLPVVVHGSLLDLPPLPPRCRAHPRRIRDGARRDDLTDVFHTTTAGLGALDVEPAPLECDIPVVRAAGAEGGMDAGGTHGVRAVWVCAEWGARVF